MESQPSPTSVVDIIRGGAIGSHNPLCVDVIESFSVDRITHGRNSGSFANNATGNRHPTEVEEARSASTMANAGSILEGGRPHAGREIQQAWSVQSDKNTTSDSDVATLPSSCSSLHDVGSLDCSSEKYELVDFSNGYAQLSIPAIEPQGCADAAAGLPQLPPLERLAKGIRPSRGSIERGFSCTSIVPLHGLSDDSDTATLLPTVGSNCDRPSRSKSRGVRTGKRRSSVPSKTRTSVTGVAGLERNFSVDSRTKNPRNSNRVRRQSSFLRVENTEGRTEGAVQVERGRAAMFHGEYRQPSFGDCVMKRGVIKTDSRQRIEDGRTRRATLGGRELEAATRNNPRPGSRDDDNDNDFSDLPRGRQGGEDGGKENVGQKVSAFFCHDDADETVESPCGMERRKTWNCDVSSVGSEKTRKSVFSVASSSFRPSTKKLSMKLRNKGKRRETDPGSNSRGGWWTPRGRGSQ